MSAVRRELAPPGRIVLRSLPGDAAVSWYQYAPVQPAPEAPVVIAIHGIARDAREQATLFAASARQHHCVLVAPRFDRDHFRDFQQLGLSGRGRRADLDLLAIIDHLNGELGLAPRPVHLAGFSGGAQFAHRFTLLHPDSVARMVLGAAGWYTLPDESRAFPYGTAAGDGLEVSLPAEPLCRTPALVAVGSRDTLRDRSLRCSDELDQLQGPTRVDRAQRWVEAVNAAAVARGLPANAELAVIPGCGHSFRQMMTRGELGERALRFLLGLPTLTD